MPRCKILRLYDFKTLGMMPRNDSAERATVPPSLNSNRNTWIACMPIVAPVQPISRGGSTTCNVETREDEPDFQRNVDPRSRAWSNVIDFTSGFHEGQPGTSAMTAHTVSGKAAIRIEPSAVAGAVRSMSTRSPYIGVAGGLSHPLGSGVRWGRGRAPAHTKLFAEAA